MKPQVSALAKAIEKSSIKVISLDGLLASATPMAFSALALKTSAKLLFVMQDADEAGYLYHDLCQVMGEKQVLFFPSSYKRAIKYGQKDPASEILRTEVLSHATHHDLLYIVTYPEALAEMVVTRKQLDARRLSLTQDQTISVDNICKTLREFGFREVDYVYEPGQFALRGSILDVYSYSHEFPFRLDFFGDDIDSIRTFEVETQLSKERCNSIDIVPELTSVEEKESILKFLPQDTLLVMKDPQFVRESIERIYQEGFSQQALQERMAEATEMEQRQIEKEMQRDSQIITGSQFANDAESFRTILLKEDKTAAVIHFNTKPQPLFHKNFELLSQTLEDYLLQGFKLYILADSAKQQERLKDIFAEMKQGIEFIPVDKTLHEGFIDVDARLCLFTDHQIFDRFHKYNLKSDKARSGKVALTLKEIQQFEVGDYVVHVDHGIGKFGGLVRMPLQDGGFQEMIKIIYQRGDAIYVSIHSLYKVSKYKSQEDGQQPRMSTLGTGQWERLKERTKKHIKDIARDLIKLYAARKHQKGFAFSHDTHPRSAQGDTGRESRHGDAEAHGPTGMRRCGLWQDRGSCACCLQGCCRWQAGGCDGAHHRTGLSALSHLPGPTKGYAR